MLRQKKSVNQPKIILFAAINIKSRKVVVLFKTILVISFTIKLDSMNIVV